MFIINKFFNVFILCAFIALSTNVAAQEQTTTEEPRLRIAVLDMKGVLKKSTAVESIQKQISEYRSGFQAEIQKEENQLRAARQELSKQRNILSPEAYAEETKKFESRIAEVQRMVQLRRQELDQSRNKAMSEVQSALNKIIAAIAASSKLNLILRREQTVLSTKSLEITGEVIKRLNVILPNITVPKPGI